MFYAISFVEAPDQVFEDQAHVVIGNDIRMQVDVGELADYQVEPVGLIELGDLLLELEVLEYLTRFGREALDALSPALAVRTHPGPDPC